MATPGADGFDEQRAVVAARLSGYAVVERLRRAELARMTEAEAAVIADELQQLLPQLPPEPDRGSGLVEQQRIFSRAPPLNGLFAAAAEIQDVLVAAGWRYCFIGGLAVQRWGEPRLTRDVDLTLLTGFGDEARFVDGLLERFESRVPGAAEFAARNRVLLLRASEGVPIDIALGALPFEERAVDRSSPWAVPGTDPLLTCSAEDLVVHKVFAARDRDWADVDGIVARQGARLDVAGIEQELIPLLQLKGDQSALARFRTMLH